MADLARSLLLSPGPLGAALFVGAAASILAMAALGRTSDLLGRRRFVALSAAVFGAGIVALSAVGSYAGLLGALVVLYAASGLYDVGINASAVDLEKVSGRRIMAYLHAAFSAGGFGGALFAGTLRSFGVGFRSVYLTAIVPFALVVLVVLLTNFPCAGAGKKEDEPSAGGLWTNLTLLTVAAIALLGLFSESEMEQWSGIYLRDSLDLSALLGGSGVAVFFGAMALGRLGAGGLISRFGNRRVLLFAGLLAALGMALSLSTTLTPLVIFGFLVVGLALSAVVPITFSLAGDQATDRAGAAVSVVTTLGYGGFLLGPVLVGGLAEAFGLRLALATVCLTGTFVFALAFRLRKS